ncbi:hypothetical protein [Aquimarina sp. RZ0]|uniref:OB-fold protein n=1 Tax=Aquimarina sp. RZ0 TaxID=2607730 RepID=UPI0011F2C27D|nr:hypothetical protein [Aquimarina sp. RZ0]KAA1243540.1 hypothetical protein F0000_20600 [Aquimarina sp. RZ0]
MKNKVVFGMSFSLLILSAAVYGICLYNKPHIDILETESEMKMTAQKLMDTYTTDKTRFSNELVGMIIEISGIITTIEKGVENTIVILDNTIKCELNSQTEKLKEGQRLKVKGIYSGFDEMFNEISMVRCYVIN